MVDFHQRIKELEKKLKNISQLFKKTSQKLENLQTQNRSQIQEKEKELEEWRQKLEVYQQEEIKIKKEIKQKVQELEQSQLSNSEKQVQINQLLTEHSAELEGLDKLFEEERSHYRQIRNKLIGKLCEPCQSCRTKEEVLQHKNQKITYLFGIIWTLIILFFIFHIWFIWLNWWKKRSCYCLKKVRPKSLK